ncbi:MAG TPA: NapC/NirT family cytochrome c [Anaerolineales bacterium]|nr:NapC/NirT family cytochrome c [Anaerolineales bacterium]
MARRGRLWLRLAALAAGSAIVLALAAGLTVSHFEESDPFCASCHTVPEVTYYDRAQVSVGSAGPYQDLSSAHYGNDNGFRCIDCHRGDEKLFHRVTALTLGARDTFIWLTGQSDPTIEKTELVVPFLLTGACVKCHTPSLLEVGFNNHFHNMLPDAYRAWRNGGKLTRPVDLPQAPLELMPSQTTVVCVDCHRAHIRVEGSERTAYLDLVNIVYPACVRCHEEAGHGPLQLAGK